MNFGRFFKLNQNLSNVVKGVIVFDYTELPAFEGLDANNPMSSKYPINMSITANAVRFKMHYCAFRNSNIKREYQQEKLQQQIKVLEHLQKQEQEQYQQLQQKKRHELYNRKVKKIIPENVRRLFGLRPVYDAIDTEIIVYGRQKPKSYSEQLIELKKQCDNLSPFYGFSIDDTKCTPHIDNPNKQSDYDEINVVHMEEVILELPFSGIGVNNLTNIIKETYIAAFPQVTEIIEYEKTKNNLQSKLIGNQYLRRLIEKKLENDEIEKKAKNQDAISYSTLWLMDLYDEDGNINLRSKGEHELIDKFLRKLLLDFMFELKHSDLFQICPRYDQMYSGLMANYYFSSLMHKGEYYYYRDLTTQAINTYEKKKQESNVGKYDENRIIYLYAKELFDAEEQWANDIRNPLSDKYFGQKFPNDFSKSDNPSWWSSWWGHLRTEICSVGWERMTINHWDSWFASPEEEMRRIYFISRADKRKTVCNSVSLTEYLHLNFNNAEDNDSTMNAASIKKELISHASESRGKSSRWFLNRFDYNDAMHMHLFRSSNLLFVVAAIIMVVLLYSCTHYGRTHTCIISFGKSILSLEGSIIILALPCILGLVLFCMYKHSQKQTNKYYNCNPLVPIYHRFAFKKLWLAVIAIIFCFCALALLIIHRVEGPYIKSLRNCGVPCILWITLSFIGLFFFLNYILTRIYISHKHYIMSASIHPIKSWHMFLPKLTASITAAWIPLTTSYNHYEEFLKSSISIPVLITIVFVVMVFFMYQVDHDCPSCSSWVKVIRSFEQLLISFCISLTIGAICLLLKRQGTLYTHMLLDVYYINYIKIWIKLSAIAMFTGLFLNAIFRSKNQMTDI